MLIYYTLICSYRSICDCFQSSILLCNWKTCVQEFASDYVINRTMNIPWSTAHTNKVDPWIVSNSMWNTIRHTQGCVYNSEQRSFCTFQRTTETTHQICSSLCPTSHVSCVMWVDPLLILVRLAVFSRDNHGRYGLLKASRGSKMWCAPGHTTCYHHDVWTCVSTNQSNQFWENLSGVRIV